MNPVEIISDGDTPLAYFVPGDWMPNQSEFLTPDTFGQQMGMIVYGAGKSIQPHLAQRARGQGHDGVHCGAQRRV
jgi:hypothetical protein